MLRAVFVHHNRLIVRARVFLSLGLRSPREGGTKITFLQRLSCKAAKI